MPPSHTQRCGSSARSVSSSMPRTVHFVPEIEALPDSFELPFKGLELKGKKGAIGLMTFLRHEHTRSGSFSPPSF
jgi:hypothetical protein